MTASDGRSRRGYLAAVAAGLVGLAGCGGGGGGDGGSGGGEGPLTGSEAATGVTDQPTLGSLADTDSTIVAFEDPSCPTCARFERDVVPRIRSELVETGETALVFRGYPVVYDWGEPAVHALEATHERSTTAHFALAEHYFRTQSAFSTETVVEETRSFLASETDVDADAVASAAADRSMTTAVEADLSAGMAAGAGRTTPHLFLFRDGGYVTKVSGVVSYDVIATALGV